MNGAWYSLQEDIANLGRSVIDVSTGDPLHLAEIGLVLRDALRHLHERPALAQEIGSYANLDGLPELRERFAARLTIEFGRIVSSADVIITPGAQAALRYVLELAAASGARVLYPAGIDYPGAFREIDGCSFGPYSSVAIGDRLCCPTIHSAGLDWCDVGFVVLSRPHNPTGCVWRRDEVAELARVAESAGAWVILDETYGLPFAPLSVDAYIPVDGPNVVHVYSFSKVGLAGERVGVVVAPQELQRPIRNLLRRNVIQAPKLGQLLAVALIDFMDSHPGLPRQLAAEYRKRWEECVRSLMSDSALPSAVRIGEYASGPFLWCEWREGVASYDVAKALLRQGVAVAPFTASHTVNGKSLNGLRIGLGRESADLAIAMSAIAKELGGSVAC
jgi:valine--pyruvate aminotransferase